MPEDFGDFEEDRAILTKDAHTRRRYLQWFNKTREDFDTNREFDDYLEMVEDVVYKLVHGIDVKETKALVEKYRRENTDSISLNAAKRAEENRRMLGEIQDEKKERMRKLKKIRDEEAAIDKEAVRKKRLMEAEELVRVTQGEEEYRKLVRRRERKERKERKRREAEEEAAGGNPKDIMPAFFCPVFPHPLPSVLPSTKKTEEELYAIPDDTSDIAAAGGFDLRLVKKRACVEFEQCLAAAFSERRRPALPNEQIHWTPAMEEMEEYCRFQRAMCALGHSNQTVNNAMTLSNLLAGEHRPSSLSVFRAASELTMRESVEVLSYLIFHGERGVPAAVRIASMMRGHTVAWETISKLLSNNWTTRDLCLLAISFEKRARFARDWTETLDKAASGDHEAKLTMAALSESRGIRFDTESLLRFDGMPVTEWNDELEFESEPSLGRELAWCEFAMRCRRVEATCNGLGENAPPHAMSDDVEDWLSEAEPTHNKLNADYFRMFDMLIQKRPDGREDRNGTVSTSRVDESFAVTGSVRQVFYKVAKGMWTGMPIIVEGPRGCGKSTVISRLAHITTSGKNVFCSGLSNICFVHMDTAVNKNDGGEFSELVGSTVPVPNEGGFQWRHGPIGHAVVNGNWLVLENLDCDHRFGNAATCALVNQLAALRPGDNFEVAGRVEPLRVGIGFRVIATRTVGLSDKDISSQWIPPGGWASWKRVYFPSLSEEEQTDILRARFPLIRDCISRVLSAIRGVTSVVEKRRKAFDREPTFREAVKICKRLNSSRCHSKREVTLEVGLSETLDVLVCWVTDDDLNSELSSICANAWSLTPEIGSVLLSNRGPQVFETDDDVRIGRSVLRKSSSETMPPSKSKLAHTKHTRRVMERIATCVEVGECVLLNGESGTGKTSTLHELARMAKKKLIVVNMSRESDISELIGGFRPLEVAAVLPALVKRFDTLLCQRVPSEKNAEFFDALYKASRNPKHHGRALRLIRGAVKAMSKSVHAADSIWVSEWARVERLTTKLLKLLPSTEARSKTKTGTEQPPRKRQRSNESQSDQPPRRMDFHFADGVLVRAMREGHWILLDEINLAPVEVLDNLVSLLDHRSLVVPNETGEVLSASSEFCLFAAMNPPTDFGKRPLAKELRSRMTEFYIEDIEDETDLHNLISHRLYAVDCSRSNARPLSVEEQSITKDVARFYLSCRSLTKSGAVDDSTGKCARFSLRTLTNMLCFAVQVRRHMTQDPNFQRRALYEGACLTFVTPLPRSSRPEVLSRAKDLLLPRNVKKKKLRPMAECIRLPFGVQASVIADVPVEIENSTGSTEVKSSFITTPAVKKTLMDVCRMLTYGVDRLPMLLQGPTSVGKTSLISYLAELTGNKLIRINNHEHTDLSEYLGSFVANRTGSLVFQEGPLVTAARKGFWIVLDELNLAPPEVLESLNRLLDDNKEIRIPETGEVVKAHPKFTLFATQNPAGVYGGRKELSRAFRGRFIEVQVDELPDDDLVKIIEERCRLPGSFAKRMVAVMRALQMRRRQTRLFSGKSGFVTARDLFRWGSRCPRTREELAVHGFFLLGERARNSTEREIVREIIIKEIGIRSVDFTDDKIYGSLVDPSVNDEGRFRMGLLNRMSELGIAQTPHMIRMCILLHHCASNNEPALLVGPTGTGKTTACSLISQIMDARLLSVNCHQHTESSDLVGGFRPSRRRTSENSALFEWCDGPLVHAMHHGDCFLMDEINMADDAVVERLNAVLESNRTLVLPERGIESCEIKGHIKFRVLATMNPGGDFGKKELSPALRNRFTEIWVPSALDESDFLPIMRNYLMVREAPNDQNVFEEAEKAILEIILWMKKDKKYLLSLREISAWCSFVREGYKNLRLAPMLGFVHGARLVFLDGISVGTSSSMQDLANEIWEMIMKKVPDDMKDDARLASFSTDSSRSLTFKSSQKEIQIGCFKFRVRKSDKMNDNEGDMCMTAMSSLRNGGRLLRAMTVDSRPILLEGPPGAGKTSMVTKLAKLLNFPLSRINLSESTEMADLLGGDVPGGSAGLFVFRKGELLRAMEEGKWVLLDEMNLASQSVLEGLNSLLDHRRSVFVPELAKEFVAHPDFRLFAAQNPASEGSGRRALPKSFLNRFVKVLIEAPTDEDLATIAAYCNPKLEEGIVNNIVRTISLLRTRYRYSDSGMEFGLRQVLRWASLVDVDDRDSNVPELVRHLELSFDVVISAALKPGAEREAAIQTFREVFGRSELHDARNPTIRKVSWETVKVGCQTLEVGSKGSFSSLGCVTDNYVCEDDLGIIQFLGIAASRRWPCILRVDSPSCTVQYGTDLLQRFAALNGRRIYKVKGGTFQDVDDLLGGFAHRDVEAQIQELQVCLEELYSKTLSSVLDTNSVSDSSRESLRGVENLCMSFDASKTSLASVNESNTLNSGVTLENMAKAAEVLIGLFPSIACDRTMTEFQRTVGELLELKRKYSKRDQYCFIWQRSGLVRAIERGDWVIFEDANRCPAAVLDRLNPLLEVSFSGSDLGQNKVLLPEAPPSVDGTPAIISAHPDFRIFFLQEDRFGPKLSRAIVDRSVSLVVTSSEKSKSSWRNAGTADIDLRCEQSLRCKEAISLLFAKWRTRGESFPPQLVEQRADVLNRGSNFLAPFSSLLTNDVLFAIKSAISSYSIRIFLLGSLSARDFSARKALVASLLKSDQIFSCNSHFLEGDASLEVENENCTVVNRFGFRLDPAFGLDSHGASDSRNFPQPLFARAVRFRFDVLVLWELGQELKKLMDEVEARSLDRNSIFWVGQLQALHGIGGRSPFSNFSVLAFRLVSMIADILNAFYYFLAFPSSRGATLFISKERKWVELFSLLMRFISAVRHTSEEAASAIALMKLLQEVSSVLSSVETSDSLRTLLVNLNRICSQRPEFELVNSVLPVPTNSSACQMELELFKLHSLTRLASVPVDLPVISKALVSLSTNVANSHPKFKDSMKRLVTILRSNTSKFDELDSTCLGGSEYPAWNCFASHFLLNVVMRLSGSLRDCKQSDFSSESTNSARILARQAMFETLHNPLSNLNVQVFAQRCSWILKSSLLDNSNVVPLFVESRIAFLRVLCSELDRQLETSRSSTGNEIRLSGTVSSESIWCFANCRKDSYATESASATACSLITGEGTNLSGVSVVRRFLEYVVSSLVELRVLKTSYSVKQDSHGFSDTLFVICKELSNSQAVRELSISKVLKSHLEELLGGWRHEIEDSVVLRVAGILSILAGALRIERFSKVMEGMLGVDPSSIAEAEVRVFLDDGLKGIAFAAACRFSRITKLGGDDFRVCEPMLRAESCITACEEGIARSRSRIKERPSELPKFSEFLSILPSYVALTQLVCNTSGATKVNGSSTSLKNEYFQNSNKLLDSSAARLELGGEMSHFRDISSELSVGVRELHAGALLFEKFSRVCEFGAKKHQSSSSALISKAMQFPLAAHSSERDILRLFLNSVHIRFEPKLQADLLRYLVLNWASEYESARGILHRGFNDLADLWKRNFLEDEEEKEKLSSLFVIKEKARVESMPGMGDLQSLEVDEEAEFQVLFDCDVEQVDVLVTGEDARPVSMTDQPSDNANSKDQTPISKQTTLDSNTFWEYHQLCFHSPPNSRESTLEEKRIAVLEVLRSIGTSSEGLPFLGEDSSVVLGTISACALSSESEKQYDVSHMYNFYKDDRPAEVAVLISSLNLFISSVAKIREKHEYPHTLTSIMETADRTVQAATYSKCLGTLVSVLENFLRKWDEWKRLFGTSVSKSCPGVDELSKLANSWRRMEVESWPNLLKIRAELSRQRATKWFYFLYDSLIPEVNDNEMSDFDSVLATMDQFLRSSPQGEFETRLTMLKSISCQLKQHNRPKQLKLSSALTGLCELYGLFLQRIRSSLADSFRPIEKKMKDFANLTKWKGKEVLGSSTQEYKGVDKELEYFRLKSKSEKVRRKLHKLCREIDSVLNASSFEAISAEVSRKGFLDLRLESKVVSQKENASLHDDIHIVLKRQFEIGVVDGPLFDDSFEDVQLPSNTRLARCQHYCTVMKKHAQEAWNSTLLENAGARCAEIRQQIRSRALELRESEDAGIQVKQRAFADLLHSLEKAGISSFENPAFRSLEKPSQWLSSYSPFDEASSLELANYYFFTTGNRLQRLRAVCDGRVRNNDLSAAETVKTLALASNFFIQACMERENLSEAVKEFMRTKKIVDELAQFGDQPDDRSLRDLLKLAQFLKRMEHIELDFLVALQFAESEASRAERVRSSGESSNGDHRYASHYAKQNVDRVRAVAELLKVGHLLLKKFVSNDSVALVMNLSEEQPAMTSQLYSAAAIAVELGTSLQQNLSDLLQQAEKNFHCSFAVSLLRPIVRLLSGMQQNSFSGKDSVILSELDKVSLMKKSEYVVEAILSSAQRIFKAPSSLESDQALDSEHEGSPRKFILHATKTIESSAKLSGLSLIRHELTGICSVLNTTRIDPSTCSVVRNLGRFTRVYLESVLKPFIIAACTYHLRALGLLKTLEGLFIGLAEEGYCRPVEQEEGNVDESGTATVEGTGFGDIGDGDASLAKDVSADVEDEEQLLGTRNESNEEQDTQTGRDKDDDMDVGVDTQTDFAGDLIDVDRQDQEDKQDDDGDQENGEEVEETFGSNPGENAVEIDEKLWDEGQDSNEGEDAQNSSDPNEMDSGRQEVESTLQARENSEDPRNSAHPSSTGNDESNKPEAEADVDEDNDVENQDGSLNEKDDAFDEESDRKDVNPAGSKESQAPDLEAETSPRDEKDTVDANKQEGPDVEGESKDVSMQDEDDVMTGDTSQDQAHAETHENSDSHGAEDIREEGKEPNEDVIDGLAEMTVDDGEDSEVEETMDANGKDTEQSDGVEFDNGDCSSVDLEQNEETSEDVPSREEDPSAHSALNQLNSGSKTTLADQDNANFGSEAQTFSNPDGNVPAHGLDSELILSAQNLPGGAGKTSDAPVTENAVDGAQTAIGDFVSKEIDSTSADHDPNPFRNNNDGDLGDKWEYCMNVIEGGSEGQTDPGNPESDSKKSNLHEFVRRDDTNESWKAGLGSATEDQHAPLPAEVVNNTEEDEKLEGDVSEDLVRERKTQTLSGFADDKNDAMEVDNPSKATETDPEPSHDISMDTEGIAKIGEHPLISAIRILESEERNPNISGSDVGFGTNYDELSSSDVCNPEDQMALAIEKETSAPSDSVDFSAMWHRLDNILASHSAVLSEQLRLVLEPTIRTGLAGSFKSGKRLDMKKVIDFVASDYRRDRIWQRRMKPAKRSYDVLIAIDNSKSMLESSAGGLGLGGLVLMISALSKLEVGRIGILRFGESCEVVRQLTDPVYVDDAMGGEILSRFTFSEKQTNIVELLASAEKILNNANGSCVEEDVQLLFVISDGRFSDRKQVRQRLRHLASRNVLVAFIVVNNAGAETPDIFRMKQVEYSDGGQVKVEPYMRDFPFEFYTVVQDVKILPNVLGNALKQWLESMTPKLD